MKSLILLATVALLGCFDPSITDGSIRCDLGSESVCPPGLQCGDDGLCYRTAPGETPGQIPDRPDSTEPGDVAWAATSRSDHLDSAHAIAANDDSVVIGGAISSRNFGFGDFELPDDDAQGLVAELSPATGEVRTARLLGSQFNDSVRAVSFDADGNLLVGGFFGHTVDFGGVERTALGGGDAFVAKYDPQDELLWVRSFPSSGTLGVVNGITVDSDSGQIFIAGSFDGETAFGSFDESSELGTSHAFVTSLRPDGIVSWVQTIGSSEGAEATAVAFADERVVVAGSFEGERLDGVAATAVGRDGFIAAFTSSGAGTWERHVAGNGDDQIHGLVARGQSVVVGGDASPGARFEGTDFSIEEGVFQHGFVAELSAGDGGTVEALPYFAGSSSSVRGLAIDDQGNLAATGWISGTVALGAEMVVASESPVAPFVVVYSPSSLYHRPQWARAFPVEYRGHGQGVAFDAAGRVAVVGVFSGAFEIGEVSATTQANADGLFVASLWAD